MLESLCFFIVLLKENVFQDIGNHLTFNCWRDWIRKSKDIAEIIFTEQCDKCLKEGTVVFSQKDMIPWKMSAIEKRKLMQDQQSCTEQNQSLLTLQQRYWCQKLYKWPHFLTETSHVATSLLTWLQAQMMILSWTSSSKSSEKYLKSETFLMILCFRPQAKAEIFLKVNSKIMQVMFKFKIFDDLWLRETLFRAKLYLSWMPSSFWWI